MIVFQCLKVQPGRSGYNIFRYIELLEGQHSGICLMKMSASIPMTHIVFIMGIRFRVETEGGISERGSRITLAGGRRTGYWFKIFFTRSLLVWNTSRLASLVTFAVATAFS